MKKNDWIVFTVVTAAALVLFLLLMLPKGRVKEPRLEILVDGKHYGTYSLGTDREIRIGEGNVCVIENGEVRMTEADCPDKSCVHSRPIAEGGSIVCLPNRVILKIVNGEEGGPDAVAE